MKIPCLSLAITLLIVTHAAAQTPRPVDFNREVRPILSDACFHCHGPDQAKRKAKLGLDTEEAARHVIVPGNTAASELVKRITASDPKKRMPPSSRARWR